MRPKDDFVLLFNPPILPNTWPQVIQSLKIVYPTILWSSNGLRINQNRKIDDFPSYTENVGGIFIEWHKDGPRLSFADIEYMEEANIKYDVDGWEYLGLTQDTHSMFDSLDESIRRVIKEELSTIKKGDKLMSTKTVPRSRTAGKIYTVLGVRKEPHSVDGDVVSIINDAGVILNFDLCDINNHFTPFDYDTTTDMFNQLDESEEDDLGWVEEINNDFSNPHTIVSIIKSLLDGTNYQAFIEDEYGESINTLDFVIKDYTGTYVAIRLNELSFERIKEVFMDVLNPNSRYRKLNMSNREMQEMVDDYQRLYDILEPVLN